MPVHVKNLDSLRKYTVLFDEGQEHILMEVQNPSNFQTPALWGDVLLFSLLEVDPANLKALENLLNTCFSYCNIGIPSHYAYSHHGKHAFPLSCLREQLFLIKSMVECLGAIQKGCLSTLLDWFGGICCTGPLDLSATDHFLSILPHTRRVRKYDPIPSGMTAPERIAQNLPFQIDIIAQISRPIFSKENFLASLSEEKKHILFQDALDACTEIINRHIQHVRYELAPRWEGSTCLLEGTWQTNNGFSSAYYELYERITGKIPICKCANPTCRGYFERYGNDNRKIYCSLHCAQLQSKRKQRARAKQKPASSQ